MSVKAVDTVRKEIQLHTVGQKAVLAIVKNHSCFILTTARPIEALQRPN